MTDGNPYPPPSPRVLADMLAMHAWSDHLDDHTRLLLEWAADSLRESLDRCVVLAVNLERAEARAA